MLWLPALNAVVLHAAVRVLPVPVSVMAPHPEIALPPSVNATVFSVSASFVYVFGMPVFSVPICTVPFPTGS